MTASTPEERAELERILGARAATAHCGPCACENAVLALIRERDKARFEAQFLCQALRFLKKEEKVNP